jgi:succinoglycan biosynthesis protein ExoV
MSPPNLGLPNNFGDELNPWLLHRLLKDCLQKKNVDQILFVGIGTLLSEKIPTSEITVVFGSGTDTDACPHMTPSWKFYCVRGPLTAKKLGLDPSLVVSDLAYLVSTVFKAQDYSKKYQVSFIPHYATSTLTPKAFKRFHELTNFHIIDPLGPVDSVLEQIASSELVVAQAMHGAIVADALRVPWIPVVAESKELYEPISKFKWRDWCSSIQLLYDPLVLPGFVSYEDSKSTFDSACQQFLRQLDTTTPYLSSDTVFEGIVAELSARLEVFQQDFLTEKLTLYAFLEGAKKQYQQLRHVNVLELSAEKRPAHITALNAATEVYEYLLNSQNPVQPSSQPYRFRKLINKIRRRLSIELNVLKVRFKQKVSLG